MRIKLSDELYSDIMISIGLNRVDIYFYSDASVYVVIIIRFSPHLAARF